MWKSYEMKQSDQEKKIHALHDPAKQEQLLQFQSFFFAITVLKDWKSSLRNRLFKLTNVTCEFA